MKQNGHPSEPYQVAIIGAGPIGLEMAVALKLAGVNYIHFDARQIGYTISWWPRNTNFFSTSERVAISGVPIQNTHQGRITGEDYLAYLRAVVEQFDLQVNTYERVTAIQRSEDGFTLQTETATGQQTYNVQSVVLAKGDMDGPNWLNIPGEDLPHVSHYFNDPHHYFRRRLLVVGGKNSAVEAALRCWRAGAQVAISYRREVFSARVKEHIRPDLMAQIELGNVDFYPETVPVEITPAAVVLKSVINGKQITVPVDFVLLATGFRANMALFEMAGVSLIGPRREPDFNPETMETNVPGLYLAGTCAAGETQDRYRLFIENTHEHVAKIMQHLTGQPPERLGTIPARNYELELKQFEAN
jgi:thioredoxin reductase (NADPH)